MRVGLSSESESNEERKEGSRTVSNSTGRINQCRRIAPVLPTPFVIRSVVSAYNRERIYFVYQRGYRAFLETDDNGDERIIIQGTLAIVILFTCKSLPEAWS